MPAAIRRARERAGLSQSQLGGRDLSRQAVHLIETGKVRPSMASLTVIAERLGVPVSTFLAADAAEPGSLGGRAAEMELLFMQRQYARLVEVADDVLGEAGDDPVDAVAQFWAGVALYHLNRAEEALVRLREAEMLADGLPNPWLVAEAMDWRAAALNVLDNGTALEVGHQALKRYRQLEPRRPEVEARMLEHLGTFWARRQGYDQAEACYRESLRVVGTVRDLERMARVYHGLAGCSRAVGDLDAAGTLMRKAVAFYLVEHELRPDGSAEALARGENDYGLLMMQQGRLVMADELVLSALDRLGQIAEGSLHATVLGTLGELRRRQGRHEEALAALGQAVDLAASLNQWIPLAEAHQQLGELHETLRDFDRADASFRSALAVLESAGLTERMIDCQRVWRRLVARRSGSEAVAPSQAG